MTSYDKVKWLFAGMLIASIAAFLLGAFVGCGGASTPAYPNCECVCSKIVDDHCTGYHDCNGPCEPPDGGAR